MNVVSDSGPLIALAKVDLLPTLAQLFGEVGIPPAVHRELFAKPGPEIPRIENALQGILRVASPPDLPKNLVRPTRGLGEGERQAIGLALSSETGLIIDDWAGRVIAGRLGIVVTGTVGVLLRAKQQGLIGSVRLSLDEIHRGGYWLSDELLDLAARLAGESDTGTLS